MAIAGRSYAARRVFLYRAPEARIAACTDGLGYGTSATTASFTPRANSKLYAFAFAINDNSTTTRAWTCSGGSLVWTKIAETPLVEFQGFGGFRGNAVMYEAAVGASPSSMTVTLTPTSVACYITWSIFDVSGGVVAHVQVAGTAGETEGYGGSDALTVSLGSSATTGNLTVACFGASSDSEATFAVPSGFASLVNQGTGSVQCAVFHREDFTGSSVTCSDLGELVGNSGAIVMELTAASSPGPIRGMLAHYDAEDAASFTFGTPPSLTAWADLSGNSRTMTSLGPPTTNPERNGTINGNTAVAFDSAAWMLVNGYTPPSQPYTVYLVIAASTETTLRPWFGTGNNIYIGRHGGVAADNIWFNGNPNSCSVNGYDASPRLVVGVFNSTSSTQRINGATVGTTNMGTGALTGLRLSDSGGGATFTLGEAIFYPVAHTSTEIAQVETYLTAKWLGVSGTEYAITASGTGTSTGSVAIDLVSVYPITASGTGVSDGAVALGALVPFAASGAGQTDGSASIALSKIPIAAEFFGAGTLAALASGTSLTASLPASTTAGMVAVVAYMYNAGTTFSTPSGWTVLGTAVNSANQSTAFFVKRLAGGDANPATTVTTMTGTNGGYGRVYVWNYVGGTAANPLEDVANDGTPTLGTTPATSAVTTDGPSRLVACIVVLDDDNTWSSGMPPSGWSNIGGLLSSATGGDAAIDAIQQTVTGSGVTVAAATVGTQSASDYWRTITFALAPSRLPTSSDGSGQSGGSAAIEILVGIPPLEMTASGTGVSGGAVNFQIEHRLTASGTGQTDGSVVTAGDLAFSASGTGTTDGSVVSLSALAVSASGTGIADGQATLRNVIPMAASGTGTSTGTVIFTGILMTASGTGLSTGSVGLISALPITGSGTGVSAGSVAISRSHPLNASGTGTTDGSVAITIQTGPVNHSMSGTGLAQTAGSAALISTLRIAASGTGVSDGSVTLRQTMPMAASGTGLADGSVSFRRLMPLTMQGTGTSGGSALLAMTVVFPGASGTGLSTGTADIGIGGVATMSASGTGTSAGHADIRFFVHLVDLGITVGEMQAVPRFIFGPMVSYAAADVDDFSPVNLIGDLEDASPVTVDGFSELTSVGPIREDM